MRRLSFLTGLLLLMGMAWYRLNPHGTNLKYDCSDCHTTEGWVYSASTARFTHDSTTFRLNGQHRVVTCRECHVSLVFSDVKTNCVNCHTDMHNQSAGLDCARCHNENSWLVSDITTIHLLGRFPLLGAHNRADCSACHVSASLLDFKPLGIECIDCHRHNYLSTTNPNHVEAGISTDCTGCHRIDALEWSSGGFSHEFFPLAQGHALNNCRLCHTTGNFEPLPAECVSCHQNDYAATANPSHQHLDFSKECNTCHTLSPGWAPALMTDHPLLNGAHAAISGSCILCHKGNYNNTPNSCFGCHSSDYNGTSNPPHQQAQFPLECETCHTELKWNPSTFNHDLQYFPIYSGRHRGEWNQCSECHTEPAAYSSFSCISCHEHNKQETDGEHSEVAGYAYNSISCFSCHPLGTAEDD